MLVFTFCGICVTLFYLSTINLLDFLFAITKGENSLVKELSYKKYKINMRLRTPS